MVKKEDENTLNAPEESPQQNTNPSPSAGRTAPNKSKYYIADLYAASEDDDEAESTSQPSAAQRARNYTETLQLEAQTSSHNKELQQHIEQTRLREQSRSDRFAQGHADFTASADAEAEAFNERFRRSQFAQSSVNIRYRTDGSVVDEEEDLKTEQLLPSAKDPKLWKVNCPVGKERESVLEVLALSQRKKGTTKQLFVQSAFASDLCRGYIYIEAFKKEYVADAVSMISSLYVRGIALVPRGEMRDTFATARRKSSVRPGEWVRVTRGVYKGDLALVQEVLEEGYKVEVQLVPRVDFTRLRQALSPKSGAAADQNKAEGSDGEEGGVKPKAAGKARKSARGVYLRQKSKVSPARLFSESEVRRFLEQFCDPEDFEGLFRYSADAIIFRGQKFVDGYRILPISLSSLELGINPTESELKRFQAGASSGAASSSAGLASRPIDAFRFRDMVKVISGDLSGLSGKVCSIKNDLVFIDPAHPDLNEPLSFSPEELEKHFEVGAHVKITKGPHKNETGFVTNVHSEDGTIGIFSDTTQKMVEAPIMDAVETSEISTGKLRLGGYTLFDFVQLDCNLSGMIIQVMQNSFKVLTDKGAVQTADLKEIKRKLWNKNVYALDKNSNQMAIGDTVKVADKNSHYAKTQATVKNIYKNSVFLHSRDIKENCSMMVVPANSLLVSGARRALKGRKLDIHGDGGSVGGRSRFRRDRWEGRYVSMVRGTYKGQRGLVKAVPNLQKFLVELLAENKVVTVARGDVEQSTDGSLIQSEELDSSQKTPILGVKTPGEGTPAYGGKTPSYGGGGYSADNKTPFYGTKTPMYGMKTPRYGSKTPSYGQNTPRHGSKTPSYGQNTPRHGSKTPSYGQNTPRHGSKTPSYGQNTPRHGSKTPMYGGKTPSFGSKTPLYNANYSSGYGEPGEYGNEQSYDANHGDYQRSSNRYANNTRDSSQPGNQRRESVDPYENHPMTPVWRNGGNRVSEDRTSVPRRRETESEAHRYNKRQRFE